MARTEQYAPETVIDAIQRGHTAVGAARLLGCSTTTVRNYAAKYKTVANALKAQRRDLVDLAEMSLRAAIIRGEGWAVSLALKTLGKDDGYTERNEVTGADGNPFRVTVEYVNDWRDNPET